MHCQTEVQSHENKTQNLDRHSVKKMVLFNKMELFKTFGKLFQSDAIERI